MKLSDISTTINDALASAGLGGARGPVAGSRVDVSDVIRRALDAAGIVSPTQPSAAAPTPAAPGEFAWHTGTNGVAQRAYRLYVPTRPAAEPMPLIVMLHGCKQDPDDFARGTRMNALAEEHGFLVAYPAQTVRANGSNCWNWFSRSEQARGGEEPSVIAAIVRQIGAMHPVDEASVFVAGLSAGAAMAVILGETYPEVFRGVAAHSGLAVGAAHDVASAFAAMQGRGAPAEFRGRPSRNKERFADARGQAVRTLVIHGDADTTVAAANADAIVAHAVEAFGDTLTVTDDRQQAGGRDCTVTCHLGADGQVAIERWTLHGAGHAWSGGDAAGSYTDARGPDASAAIVRFFLGR